MSEELNEVVKEEASQATEESTPTETEQDPFVSEDVENTESEEVDYQALYEKEKAIRENLKKALKAERSKEKESAPQPETAYEQPEPQTDEGVKRFLRTEADAFFAKKLALEPSFREIMPEIETLVEQGFDVRTAETMVKSKRYDTIATQLYQEAEQAPKQIKTRAIPESAQIEATLDTIAEGKVKGATREDVLLANAMKNLM